MPRASHILWPLGAGAAGAGLLPGLYFGIVSWAESPRHAATLFWEDRWLVMPLILGFGVQAALYIILKKRLFVPVAHTSFRGTAVLEGASQLTLTIRDVDVPERTFVWSLID